MMSQACLTYWCVDLQRSLSGMCYLLLYNTLQFSVVFLSGSVVLFSCNTQRKESRESFYNYLCLELCIFSTEQV